MWIRRASPARWGRSCPFGALAVVHSCPACFALSLSLPAVSFFRLFLSVVRGRVRARVRACACMAAVAEAFPRDQNSRCEREGEGDGKEWIFTC